MWNYILWKKNSHYGTTSTVHLNSYIGLVHDFLLFTRLLLKMHFTSASFNALRFSLSWVKVILVFFFMTRFFPIIPISTATSYGGAPRAR